ncbi:MAG TPA: helix-hairpin-helix domain-containing protein [Candidatus Binatia bacterium]|nr:helix-hairpin-helix domain-containing protein [Candidatus Binatia bacterium]
MYPIEHSRSAGGRRVTLAAMELYARSEVKLLLVLAGAVLAGLGAREWRAGFPEHADRLERLDRDPAAAPPAYAARGESSAARGHGPVGPCPASPPPPLAPGVPARVEEMVGPVDVNRASAEELARLPGVGPALARRIVEERERGGRFASPDALRRVLGMGPRTLTAIRARVTAGGDRPGAVPSPPTGPPGRDGGAAALAAEPIGPPETSEAGKVADERAEEP